MPARSERATLVTFLHAQRRSVLAILEGLDERLEHRQIVPSGWTPAGLVRHLALAERFWFSDVLVGWSPVDSPTADELPSPGVGCGLGEASRFYREEAARSDLRLAAVSLDEPPRGSVPSDLDEEISDVRALILHMIEETARHAGHLDIARELIDGRTGLGPR